ncbi:MAG TPA: hypothetical protein VLC09_05340 [Polyangiaceae bacterium]|nr:hypothetical protein [Polyangiaceae bacterium]
MWKLLSLLVLGACLAIACGDGGDPFADAEVLAFAVAGETVPSRIQGDERRIEVTLPDDSTLRAAHLETLKLSTRASSDLAEGDVLDLSAPHTFEVTSENGQRADWTIVGTSENQGVGGAAADCDVELATYRLEGKFQITDTAGDAIVDVGPGEAVLRITRGEGPQDARLVSYRLTQKFVTGPSGLASVRTDNETSSGPVACGIARGQLEDGVLTWDECDYGPAPPHGTVDWTWQTVVGGPGCMADYHAEGTISCTGVFCSAGGDFPIDLDKTYPQPLNSFVFSSDGNTFEMENLGGPETPEGVTGVELPNEQQGRAWLALYGTRVSSTCAVDSCDGD